MESRHTILVVDDEPDVVKSVQDLLRLDYRVLGATRAEDGLRLMDQQDVHVVMSDQRMAGMTGVEFLRRVRDQHPDAIRLLFTGYADIRAVIDAINQGSVYRYITKPWDPDELLSLINEAVQRYELLADRKRLVSEVQTQNQTLERTNAELAGANQELSRASELKTAFIRVASHELRTPLTILLGLTKLSLKAQHVPPTVVNWLGRIEQAARRLQYLVDQLIQMLQAGDYEKRLQRRPEDVATLLNQAADDVRPFVELRGQSLSVELAGALGTADVDAPKIRDSVNHLLLNAIKFTPDGGRVSLQGSSIDGDGVQIRVTDTGPGIDADAKERLFEPFFTGYDVLHHSSGQFEHNRKGLGLGLAVVKAFVEMHGGRVTVESEVGRGTTFSIHLPRNGTNGAATTSDATSADSVRSNTIP